MKSQNNTMFQDNYTDGNGKVSYNSERSTSLYKKPLKMVPSTFEPPPQQTNFTSWDQSLTSANNVANYSTATRLSTQVSQQEKMKVLKDVIGNHPVEHNVQFIWKLIPINATKQIVLYQEGDQVSIEPDTDKWLILYGQLQFTGENYYSYRMKKGYFFFNSALTKSKINKIVAKKPTKLLRITNQVYSQHLKSYIDLKQAEKFKFIKICPFFIWRDSLSDQLSSTMYLIQTQKQEIIYRANAYPEAIYFVKQGIVLLQRNTKIKNPIFKDYQRHYEKNEITQKDAILVVRKGMAFGIDGIIIKQTFDSFRKKQLEQPEVERQSKNLKQIKFNHFQSDSFNPENQFLARQLTREDVRIYNAKSLGKCQLYVLRKEVLETLFSPQDINKTFCQANKIVSDKQFERVSIQYTNMIMSDSFKNSHVCLKNKDFVFPIKQKQEVNPQIRQFKNLKKLKNPNKQKNKNFKSHCQIKLSNLQKIERLNNIILVQDDQQNTITKIYQRKSQQLTQHHEPKNKLVCLDKFQKYRQNLPNLPKIITEEEYQSSRKKNIKQQSKLAFIAKKQIELTQNTKISNKSIVEPKLTTAVAIQSKKHKNRIDYKSLKQRNSCNKQQEKNQKKSIFMSVKSYKSITTPSSHKSILNPSHKSIITPSNDK